MSVTIPAEDASPNCCLVLNFIALGCREGQTIVTCLTVLRVGSYCVLRVVLRMTEPR